MVRPKNGSMILQVTFETMLSLPFTVARSTWLSLDRKAPGRKRVALCVHDRDFGRAVRVKLVRADFLVADAVPRNQSP